LATAHAGGGGASANDSSIQIVAQLELLVCGAYAVG
jgi:hypothetical protein